MKNLFINNKLNINTPNSYIIYSDDESKKIVAENQKKKLSNIWEILLEIWLLLSDYYSFVENQTYPRPSHPLEKLRKNVLYTIMSIIISIRTTLENEKIATNKLIESYPNIQDLEHAKKDDIAEIIKVAWMQNTKAEKIIHILEKDIAFDEIIKLNQKEISEILLKLPWIWQKATDCILLLWLDLPSFVIDINVFRVIKRFLNLDPENMNYTKNKQIIEVKKILEDNLPRDTKLFQILHTYYLLHWKYICKSKPECKKCKLSNKCMYYKNLNH